MVNVGQAVKINQFQEFFFPCRSETDTASRAVPRAIVTIAHHMLAKVELGFGSGVSQKTMGG